jgi:ribosome-dependent ATPase
MTIFESGQNFIKIESLTHRYAEVVALDEFSLSVSEGETLAVIGPDGVGKSTLLGIIAGIKRLQAGRVWVMGCDFSNEIQREKVKAKVAYMRQGLGFGLYPTLSVLENIRFVSRLFGLSDQETDRKLPRLLEATGLYPFLQRQTTKLSGGMKQKLQLCCSLIHSPDLLILDEPTTGVDPLSRRQFWALLDELRDESPKMTLITATAYMEEAARFDRLVAMNDGKILTVGTYKEVLANTQSQTLEMAYSKLLAAGRNEAVESVIFSKLSRETSPSVIEAFGLSKTFKDFLAVDNVDINVARGEIFGFLGPNGCGKTTTMKMLTGLLIPSGGTAKLFGASVDASDVGARRRLGYMSQAFSLYQELSVRENLRLHAVVCCVEVDIEPIIQRTLVEFDLEEYASSRPMTLSLGIRKRLELAAACLHEPDILILDEPTSGVDPLTRNRFWQILVSLSRRKNVTIFISTHFMNEAEWCDRVSMMSGGKLLAIGSPSEIMSQCGASSLEEAFIWFLEHECVPAQSSPRLPQDDKIVTLPDPGERASLVESALVARLRRIFAYASCEFAAVVRNRTRLAFTLFGPALLLWVAAHAISFNLEKIKFTAIDLDQSEISRDLLSQFSPPYFHRIGRTNESEQTSMQALVNGLAQMVVEIPPAFGRDALSGRQPEVAVYVDGSKPFLGSSVRGYAAGVVANYLENLSRASGIPTPMPVVSIEPRLSYNQDFKSMVAIVPGFIMVSLTLFPTMMTALGIVREKDLGTITNLYSSPGGLSEFLIGKQVPHICFSMVAYFILVAVAVFVAGISIKGSFFALSVGAFLFIAAVTAFGLFVSAIATSEVAAIVGTAIISLIISMNYSGLMYPVSTLTGARYWIAVGTPTTWFQQIALGCFTKGLAFLDFQRFYLALAGFAILYFVAARAFLRKQEM